MSRYAKDPDLTAIAKQVDQLKFSSQLNDDQEALVGLIGTLNRPGRRIGLLPGLRTWTARFYVGGAIRTVAISTNVEMVVRFADAFQMYFWKYRIRGAKPPLDCDLNLDAEQAKHDVSDPAVVFVLEQIEAHLLKLGAIHDSATLEEARAHDRLTKRNRKSLRGDLLRLHDELIIALEALDGKADGRMDRILQYLTRLESRIQMLEKQQALGPLSALLQVGDPVPLVGTTAIEIEPLLK